MTLGDRIKRRRTALRLTQQELAARAQVRRETITELETYRRRTVNSEMLRRLARALGWSPQEIYAALGQSRPALEKQGPHVGDWDRGPR